MEKNESQEKKIVINFDEWEPKSKEAPKWHDAVIYPDGTTNVKPDASSDLTGL